MRFNSENTGLFLMINKYDLQSMKNSRYQNTLQTKNSFRSFAFHLNYISRLFNNLWINFITFYGNTSKSLSFFIIIVIYLL